jgi:CheY-like chemotaxis protein
MGTWTWGCAKPASPRLMLTARDGEESERRGLNLGADDYVTQPVLLSRVGHAHPRAPAAEWREVVAAAPGRRPRAGRPNRRLHPLPATIPETPALFAGFWERGTAESEPETRGRPAASPPGTRSSLRPIQAVRLRPRIANGQRARSPSRRRAVIIRRGEGLTGMPEAGSRPPRRPHGFEPSRQEQLRGAIAREEARLARLETERAQAETHLVALRSELAALGDIPRAANPRRPSRLRGLRRRRGGRSACSARFSAGAPTSSRSVREQANRTGRLRARVPKHVRTRRLRPTEDQVG